MQRVRVHIEGTVQGVYFRESTREQAERLGVRGWVRNLPDGRVHGVFEGSDEAIGDLLAWCAKGPAGAEVERFVIASEEPKEEFASFEVRR